MRPIHLVANPSPRVQFSCPDQMGFLREGERLLIHDRAFKLSIFAGLGIVRALVGVSGLRSKTSNCPEGLGKVDGTKSQSTENVWGIPP